MRIKLGGVVFFDIQEMMKLCGFSYSYSVRVARRIGKRAGKRYLIEEAALVEFLRVKQDEDRAQAVQAFDRRKK